MTSMVLGYSTLKSLTLSVNAPLVDCSNFDDYMIIVIRVHDYNNFQGGKTYLAYPLDKIYKFWPSKWEKKFKIKIVVTKNGFFNYTPKQNKILEEEITNTLIFT
jgi:hypothetical protein